MNLVQIKSFVTVARVESFTRAASRLNVSQPAISGHVRGLEEELGIQLFIRDHRKVTLSEQGRSLLVHAENVLASMDKLAVAAQELSSAPTRTMRLGIVVGAETVRMGPLLNLLARVMPRVRIDVAQGLSGWVAAQVYAGHFDCGFYLGPNPPPGVIATELTQLTYILCTPAEWEARARSARREELAQLPWIWAPATASYPHIVKEMFREHGVTPRQVIEADREATIADLVASGIGMAILREPIARKNAAEGKVAIIETIRTQVPMYFLTPPDPDPLVRQLRASVLDVFGLTPSPAEAPPGENDCGLAASGRASPQVGGSEITSSRTQAT